MCVCVCMLSPNMCDLHAYANYIIMRNNTTTSANAPEINAKKHIYAARILQLVTCQSIRNLEGSAFIPSLVVHSPRCSSQMSRTSSSHPNTRLNHLRSETSLIGALALTITALALLHMALHRCLAPLLQFRKRFRVLTENLPNPPAPHHHRQHGEL